MLAKPTNPLVRSAVELRVMRPDGSVGDRIFQGWGVTLPDALTR
jgi:hypothetical protein